MIGLLSDHSITRVGRREAVHKARSCETRAGWSPNFAVPAGQGKPASARRRVQLQGAARRPGARRTSCTLSARLRAATKQMGPSPRASLELAPLLVLESSMFAVPQETHRMGLTANPSTVWR